MQLSSCIVQLDPATVHRTVYMDAVVLRNHLLLFHNISATTATNCEHICRFHQLPYFFYWFHQVERCFTPNMDENAPPFPNFPADENGTILECFYQARKCQKYHRRSEALPAGHEQRELADKSTLLCLSTGARLARQYDPMAVRLYLLWSLCSFAKDARALAADAANACFVNRKHCSIFASRFRGLRQPHNNDILASKSFIPCRLLSLRGS